MSEGLSQQSYNDRMREFVRLGSQDKVVSLAVEGPLEEPLREPFMATQVISLFKEKTNGEESQTIAFSGFQSEEERRHALVRIASIDIADRMTMLKIMNPEIDAGNLAIKQEAEEFLRRNNYPIAVLGLGHTGLTGKRASVLFYHPGLPVSETLNSFRSAARRYLERNKE